MITVITGLLAGLAGIGLGYLIRLAVGSYQAESTEKQAELMLKEAKLEAESIRKEGRIQVKADVLKMREDFEKSTESKRKELSQIEERIVLRETNLDRKVAMLDKKEQNLENKLQQVDEQKELLLREREQVSQLIAQKQTMLQQVAGMSEEDAKQQLLQNMEQAIHSEIGGMIRRAQEQAKETCEREAHKIVAQAIERYSASHANQMMTSTVALPSDDMKGRIIGREGRNIRALEAVTGVNILIDDTPEAVVISGFDPIRREIARQTLEQLIADGRIHPARIEEVVAKAEESMAETIRAAGEEALYLTGIQGVEPELSRTIGRLKFRTSYTQNVLQHAIEVSHLMGVMAGELSLDVSVAKRVGLFHDIGKALDHEIEGGHAIIGADLLKRHGEAPLVVNAVAAHHEEVEAQSLYAVLCSAADTISSSRVGARCETTDIYVKRLEKLEALAAQFEGVDKCYAIQAGREVRVIVEPDAVDDNSAMVLARNISNQIEKDLQYPGQIRVTVIRETRCVEYAH